MIQEHAQQLLDQMIQLKEGVLRDGQKIYDRWKDEITEPSFESSALNLSYYLALRRRDIRALQEDLSNWGLSSLGRLESRVMDTIDAVIASLTRITQRKNQPPYPTPKSILSGRNQLRENTDRIFGKRPEARDTRIMVTLPTEAATDYEFVKHLIEKGMNIARINCAHDDEDIWLKTIKNIRQATRELNTQCKILMDIAGPKARIHWFYVGENIGRIQVNDELFLTDFMTQAIGEKYSIVLGCSLPEILESLKVGDPILIDDGQLEGEIIKREKVGVLIKVNKVQNKKGFRLRADKGLNFPKTEIKLGIVTEKDHQDLKFVMEHADIAGCSFVKNANDLMEFISILDKHEKKIPVLAKIETVQGVSELADIIMSTAGKHPFSIMVARGDLAVESGYLRLAELQQEILWICEAGDIPTVWATEVLDNMVKTGIPTRAEITDAAEGGIQAECVMLNKGNYISETVVFLDKLIQAMEENQYKKSSRLRALNLAKNVSLSNEN